MSDVVMTEYRFKRNKEVRRGGWVEGRSEATGIWHTLIYAHSLRSANRWVVKDIKNSQVPDIYTDLPLIKISGNPKQAS